MPYIEEKETYPANDAGSRSSVGVANVYSRAHVAGRRREPKVNMGATLEVVVNGERAVTRSRTLAELIVELGYGDAKVATARNGDFVPLGKRAAVALSKGDNIEIVSPRQGG
jgi:sulfur carrier protein